MRQVELHLGSDAEWTVDEIHAVKKNVKDEVKRVVSENDECMVDNVTITVITKS